MSSFSAACLLASLVGATFVSCSQEPQPPQDPAQRARWQVLRDAGRMVPLTIHRVQLLERPDLRAAQVVALLLERQGMGDLTIADEAFVPPAQAPWDDVAAAFAAHVRAAPNAQQRHHLWGEFVGTPQTGPTEVRWVLVDGQGEIVLSDRQTPADAAFARTAGRDPDPLGCAMLLGERVFTLAGWRAEPGAVENGRFAKLWQQMSGLPDEKEFAAIDTRRAAFAKVIGSSRLVVLPTIAGGGHDPQSASRLADALGKEFGCSASAPAEGARIEVRPDSNEQKRLWDLARRLQAAVREKRIDGDHAAVVEIGLRKEKPAGYVHVVICDAAGDFVVVDMQNDQHDMLKSAAPRTVEEAERFAVARLAKLLR